MRLVVAALLAISLVGCAHQPERDAISQVSTIDSLMAGEYDGQVPLRTLYKQGDFGLGTLDRLDGELVVVDGVGWQIPVEGPPRAVSPDETTPFTALTFFNPDLSMTLKDTSSNWQGEVLSSMNPNGFYAIRVEGRFSHVTTRSVPRQRHNRPLVEVLEDQKTFEMENVEGTMVGLYYPTYVKGLNVPGFHFHFITADRTGGGHVLSSRIDHAMVSIDESHTFNMLLSENFNPGSTDEAALDAVEKGTK